MLSEAKLNRIINSVLREARYDYPKDPNAVRKGKIQIDHCSLEKAKSSLTGEEKEYIAVYLGHVFGNGAQTLVNAINASVPKTVMNAVINQKGNCKVVIRVNIEKKAEIPQVVNQLKSALVSLNDYDSANIDELCDGIFTAVDSVATTGDIENAEQLKMTNWREMMKRLEDPNVRKQLLMFQTTNNYAHQYGHILSPNNVISILTQCPGASFVTEASTWLKKFNRKVNPNAQRIVVTKAYNSANWKELDDAARRAGYKDFKDAKIQSGNSPQVIGRIKIMAGGGKRYDKVVMFDVRDTTPIDPNNDIWTEKIGLRNNLTGELNKAAEDFDKMINGQNDPIVAANKEKIMKAKNEEMPNRRAAMEKLCNKNPWGVKVDTTPFASLDDANFIARGAYHLAKQVGSLFGLVKPENMEKLAVLSALGICISSGIDYTQLQLRLSAPSGLTDEEYMQSHTICSRIIPALGNAVRVNSKDIKSLNKENFNRRNRMINERLGKGTISLQQFLSSIKDEFGVNYLGDEPNNDMAESRRIIKRIVNEEVRRLLSNRRRR